MFLLLVVVHSGTGGGWASWDVMPDNSHTPCNALELHILCRSAPLQGAWALSGALARHRSLGGGGYTRLQ